METKKEKYFEPEIEITRFMSEDVITVSGVETDEKPADSTAEYALNNDNDPAIFNS